MRPQHNADRTDRGPDITRTKSVSAQAGHVGSAKWPRSEPIDPAHRPSAAAASYLETVDGQFSTSERRIAVSATDLQMVLHGASTERLVGNSTYVLAMHPS